MPLLITLLFCLIKRITTVKYAPSLVKYFRASNFTGQESYFTWQAFYIQNSTFKIFFFSPYFLLRTSLLISYLFPRPLTSSPFLIFSSSHLLIFSFSHLSPLPFCLLPFAFCLKSSSASIFQAGRNTILPGS